MGEAGFPCSTLLDAHLSRMFRRLGQWCGQHPRLVGLCVVLACAAGAVGLTTADEERRVEKLWVPRGSDALNYQQVVEDVFGADARVSQVLIEATDTGGNVLDRSVLAAAFALHDRIAGGATDGVALADICVLDDSGACLTGGLLAAWSFSRAAFDADPDPVHTARGAIGTVGEVRAAEVVGGLELADGAVTGASALRLVYLVRPVPEGAGAAAYERDVLAWESHVLDQCDDAPAGTRVFCFAQRSMDDELERAVGGDMFFVTLCFVAIIAFTCAVLGRCNLIHSRVLLGLGGVLGIALSMALAFGVAAASGAMWTSLTTILPFLIIGMGVDDMFLLCAALDAVCFGYCLPGTASDRTGEALGKAGPSITMTSLTSMVAFTISAIGGTLPAMTAFSTYAAIAVLADFAVQVTGFVVLMGLDTRRQDARRADVLPCIIVRPAAAREADTASHHGQRGDVELAAVAASSAPGGDQQDAAADGEGSPAAAASSVAARSGEGSTPAKARRRRPVSCVRRVMANKYAPLLLSNPMRAAVLVVFAAVLSGASLLATRLEQGIAVPDDIVPVGSYAVDFFGEYNRLFAPIIGQSPLYVVTGDADFSLEDVQDQALALADAIETDADSEFLPPLRFWLRDFLAWLPANAEAWELGPTGRPAHAEAFNALLLEFLASPAGADFAGDVVASGGDSDGKSDGRAIYNSRMMARYPLFANTAAEKDAMLRFRRLVSDNAGVLLPDAFPFSFDHLFVEQYVVIVSEAVGTLGAAAACTLAITILFLGVLSAPLLAMCLIIFINVDLLGVMVLLNVKLNSVSSAILVLGVGLSVDYCVHVLHAFMHFSGTKAHRAKRALSSTGAAVLYSGLSTLIGVAVLGFTNSPIFQVFFKMLSSIIIISLLHALVLLPVVLSIAGPQRARSAQPGPPCLLAKIESDTQSV